MSTRIFRIVNTRIAPARPALIRARGAWMFTFARAIPSQARSAITSSRLSAPIPRVPARLQHPGITSTFCHGRNRSIRYRMPAPSRIFVAVDILLMSKPEVLDIPLLSDPPEAADRSARDRRLNAGYRTTRLWGSQTRAAVARRTRPRRTPAPTTAAAPPARASHGPSQGDVNAGGSATERIDATTTITAAARTGSPLRDRVAASRSPTTAATAATSDHRKLSPQAPNGSDPVPNRLHGTSVAAAASPNPATAIQRAT